MPYARLGGRIVVTYWYLRASEIVEVVHYVHYVHSSHGFCACFAYREVRDGTPVPKATMITFAASFWPSARPGLGRAVDHLRRLTRASAGSKMGLNCRRPIYVAPSCLVPGCWPGPTTLPTNAFLP